MPKYIVYRWKVGNQRASFLQVLESGEDALDAVKDEAIMYAERKNRTLIDHTSSSPDTRKSEERSLKYCYRNSKNIVNTIEVYKQYTKVLKGYLKNSIKDYEETVALFSFNRFDGEIECDSCGTYTNVSPQPSMTRRSLPVPFHPELINELKNTDMFQRHRTRSEVNSQRPSSIELNEEM